MEQIESSSEIIKEKLRANFDGKIVRKDLTKKIKEGANVPVYVLEFLLGQYCSSDDPEIVENGVQTVKRILADNFVRPDEAQKILSMLRKKGSHTVIDMITVRLDIKKDCFFAEFSNLGLTNVPIADEYPEKFDRLLGDRIGNHRLLLMGLFYSFLLYFLCGFAGSALQLGILRFAYGFGVGALMPSVNSLLTKMTPKEGISRIFSFNQSFSYIGQVKRFLQQGKKKERCI